MKTPRLTTGFTLVELSLSLAFIGVLSLTTVLIINNTVLAYRRGLTLNQVNTVGMELVDDIRTTVQNSPAQGCTTLEGSPTADTSCLYFIENSATPTYGGFCTGQYSYIWQSPDGSSSFFRKISDPGRNVCSAAAGVAFDINSYQSQGEELISDGSGLALYNLTVSAPATSNATNTAYYSISFILGTTSGGPSITATGDYCKPPEDAESNFNYCSINKFNFAAQAGGGYNAT